MKLKIGPLAVKKTPEEFLEMGFKHVEIDLIKPHSNLETFTASRIKTLIDIIKRKKATISIHIPYTVNPSDPIEMIRRANVKYFEKCIILASKIGAKYVTAHIGYCNGLPTWKGTRENALERLALSLKKILGFAKKYKIYLALENVNPMPADSEFFYLGDSMNDFDYLFSKVRSPYLKMCLDVGHANTIEGPLAYVTKYSDKIIGVHIHDNGGKYDEHLAIGEGNIDWKKLVLGFKKIKFDGPFVTEIPGDPFVSREALLKFF
jgi:sugar phosphate isomerase/epimerase